MALNPLNVLKNSLKDSGNKSTNPFSYRLEWNFLPEDRFDSKIFPCLFGIPEEYWRPFGENENCIKLVVTPLGS